MKLNMEGCWVIVLSTFRWASTALRQSSPRKKSLDGGITDVESKTWEAALIILVVKSAVLSLTDAGLIKVNVGTQAEICCSPLGAIFHRGTGTESRFNRESSEVASIGKWSLPTSGKRPRLKPGYIWGDQHQVQAAWASSTTVYVGVKVNRVHQD